MAGAVGQRIEKSLLPLPDEVSWNQGRIQKVSLGFCEKVHYFAVNFFKFALNVICLPPALAYSFVASLFSSAPKKAAAVYEPLQISAFPAHFGFADSLFQTSGLGTRASATPLEGVSNWDKWLNPQRIEGTGDGDYQKFFVDVLKNPDPFIQILTRMNVSAHRFSLEWSVIEPREGELNHEAIRLYRNFIQKLKDNGIEPYVTLHHFVCPEWFEQKGGFAKLENVEIFKRHAVRMMTQVFPDVINWMPFNEINVDGFQKSIRGVYPPGGDGDIAGAGVLMRNMLLAHCQIYQEAKEHRPELQIGSTHQWLKFEPLEGNPLEKAICYFLSKITHYACYNFFKTGKFSLETPGKANVQLSIPEEEWRRHNGFSDFIGVQFYGFPRLKAGFNGGVEYPGYKIVNKFGLTFGSTCPKGGKMMSFGPGFYPESLNECLDEALALNKPIVISETGCDAMVQRFGERGFQRDNRTQEEYFERIIPILEKARGHLKAFFAWTVVSGHLEWDRGNAPRLGVVDIYQDANGKIIGHSLPPAAHLLQHVYRMKQNELAQQRQQVA